MLGLCELGRGVLCLRRILHRLRPGRSRRLRRGHVLRVQIVHVRGFSRCRRARGLRCRRRPLALTGAASLISATLIRSTRAMPP